MKKIFIRRRMKIPFIVRDFSRCILCGRCVQACNEVVVNRAISQGYRGQKARSSPAAISLITNSECVFCGQCVRGLSGGCPDGKEGQGIGTSLGNRKDPDHLSLLRRRLPASAPCQGRQDREDYRRRRRRSPIRDGCASRAVSPTTFIYSEDRLKTPLIREENGEFREASWDEALDLVAAKFKEIIEKHGPGCRGRRQLRPQHQRRFLPDAEAFPGGVQNEQHRSLRPYLTRPHCRGSRDFIRFRRHDELFRRFCESENDPGDRLQYDGSASRGRHLCQGRGLAAPSSSWSTRGAPIWSILQKCMCHAGWSRPS